MRPHARAVSQGLILGVVLAAVPGLIWSLTMQATGTAPVMMGGEPEQWTARELRKMRRHGWLVVNHFLLRRDDVDHVLIGPGGVYAVETNWSASWDSDFARARKHDAVRQAASSARSMGLWEPLRKHGLKVHPVVVLWGGGLGKWEGTDRIRVLNGVPVLVGPAVGDWAESLGTSVLNPAAVKNAWTAIDTQARSRDAFDRSTHPVPMSVAEYVARCGVGVASAFLGFLGVAQLLEWTDSTASVVGIGAGTLVPAVVLLRLRRLRAGSWGWIARSRPTDGGPRDRRGIDAGGRCRIRTCEGILRRIYSPLPLAARATCQC